MPEIPDIENFCFNLKVLLQGKKLKRFKVVNGKKLKDKQSEFTKQIEGKTIQNIYRSGKEIRFEFSNKVILGMHLMLTGDIIPFEKENERKSTIVEFYFNDGTGIALTDRMKNANVKLNPEDKEGIDALDSKLNYKYLKELIGRKANIKNILLDQNKIRGIGNSYSDEILWASKISPFSIGEAIPDDKIKELAKNIKSVLKSAIKKIGKEHPGVIHGEIKDYLNIHTKKKATSPTGFPIKTVERGMLKTYYTDEQVVYE